MTRRQFSSCDPCRQSKRRCEPAQPMLTIPHRTTCSNCLRLRLNCTYDFASSKRIELESRRRMRDTRRRPGSIVRSPASGTTISQTATCDEIFSDIGNPECPNFDELMESFSDPFGLPSLEYWSNSNLLDDNGYSILGGLLSAPMQHIDVAGSATCSASGYNQSNLEMTPLPSPRIQHRRKSTYSLSLSGSLCMLNRSHESKILGEKLSRVYKNIAFLSVSSFLGKGCNPFIEQDFDLEKEETAEWKHIPDDTDPLNSPPTVTGPVFPDSQETLRLTMIGAAFFLDHFGTLYGNGLDKMDHQRAQIALEDVLHAFSSQWIQQHDSHSASNTAPAISKSGFAVHCWYKARSSLVDAQRVRSFKTVWAMLLFNMTTIPSQFVNDHEGSDSRMKNDFLGDCISHLIALRQMVIPYCKNLGSGSTYAKALQISLSLFSWLAILRDSTTSITRLKPPILGNVTGDLGKCMPWVYQDTDSLASEY